MLDANHKSLQRYKEKMEHMRKKFDQSFRRLGRFMNICIRHRNKVIYLEDRIQEVLDADKAGKRFNERQPRKPKAGRKIEL